MFKKFEKQKIKEEFSEEKVVNFLKLLRNLILK